MVQSRDDLDWLKPTGDQWLLDLDKVNARLPGLLANESWAKGVHTVTPDVRDEDLKDVYKITMVEFCVTEEQARSNTTAPARDQSTATWMPIEESQKPGVFVVHGHDIAALNRVELILHRIGATPITLRKVPKNGKTWIELLEEHLPAANAVVVFMTPDDEGRAVGEDSSRPRVRENVLVEAGCAVINNRKRSILIALGGVSIPSDFDGISRIESQMLDKSVEVELAKRLAEMGLAVNPAEAI